MDRCSCKARWRTMVECFAVILIIRAKSWSSADGGSVGYEYGFILPSPMSTTRQLSPCPPYKRSGFLDHDTGALASRACRSGTTRRSWCPLVHHGWECSKSIHTHHSSLERQNAWQSLVYYTFPLICGSFERVWLCLPFISHYDDSRAPGSGSALAFAPGSG